MFKLNQNNELNITRTYVNYKLIWGYSFITFVCVINKIYKIKDYKYCSIEI